MKEMSWNYLQILNNDDFLSCKCFVVCVLFDSMGCEFTANMLWNSWNLLSKDFLFNLSLIMGLCLFEEDGKYCGMKMVLLLDEVKMVVVLLYLIFNLIFNPVHYLPSSLKNGIEMELPGDFSSPPNICFRLTYGSHVCVGLWTWRRTYLGKVRITFSYNLLALRT